MPVSRRLPPILLLPLALAAAGCLSPTVTDEPLVLGAAGPVSVDVDSFRGDVTITVDPDAAGATVRVIRAASHGAQRGGEARASLGEIAWETMQEASVQWPAGRGTGRPSDAVSFKQESSP